MVDRRPLSLCTKLPLHWHGREGNQFFLYFEWKLSVSGSSCPPQASEATNRGSPPPGAAPVISAFSPPCAAAHILPPKGSSRKPRLRRDSSQKFGAMGAVFWKLWMCNYRAGRYFLKPKLCETFLAPPALNLANSAVADNGYNWLVNTWRTDK